MIVNLQEYILYKIDVTKINKTSLLFLTNQNIDVFNLSSPFYINIWFHFDSPIDKDINLKDRVLIFFPNITLCKEECQMKRINFISLKADCICIFNNNIENSGFVNKIVSQKK